MYIFGYGSLVNIEKLRAYLGREGEFSSDELLICKLKGFRRIWNVAMDNSVDLPSYKHYLELQSDGSHIRPNSFVTFLNIEPHKASEVVGVLFRVNEEMLKRLSSRERNYELLDITASLDVKIGEKAYAFVATESGLQRFARGLAEGSAVVSSEYFEFVREAYKDLELNKNKLRKYFRHHYEESLLDSYQNTTFKDDSVPLRPLVKVGS